MAPAVLQHPEARPTATKEDTVDTKESSARAHPSTEEHEHQDERPHACIDGWVTIGQMVVDEETGEETEEFALYLCQRCANDK